MTQCSQSPADRPGRRGDSPRPPRTRRGGDRAPYPGAPAPSADTRTRGTYTTRPGGSKTTTRQHARTTSVAPTPATVWACGPEPIDPHQPWPVPIVEAITTAFTTPGARVLLVNPNISSAAVSVPESDGTIATSTAAVTAALDAVRALKRTGETLDLDGHSDTSTVDPQPFWADLITGASPLSAGSTTMAPSPVAENLDTRCDTAGSGASERVDLVLIALPAHVAEAVSLDRLALLAADRLRCGGILTVYTHSDWNGGRLLDPTGPIVAAAQNADLVYLQHIVTLHTPIRGGRLHPGPTPAAAEEYGRARHHATVGGLPAPHLRAHGDVLVFAQPSDLGAPLPQPEAPPTVRGGEPGRTEGG
jgi:hypothetical protein